MMAQLASKDTLSRFRTILRQRPWLVAALGCCMVLALVVSLGAVFLGSRASAGVLIERDSADGYGELEASLSEGTTESVEDTEDGDAEGEPVRIVVDVDGAVVSPQVVELTEGARVADALEAAGGLTADADISSVNRAALIADGQKLYIPRVGEEAAAGGTSASNAATAAAADAATDSSASGTLVNLNTATETELDVLPGIGPATASAIVEDRETNGPFSSPEDLMRVSGIGEKKFAKLQNLVCV